MSGILYLEDTKPVFDLSLGPIEEEGIASLYKQPKTPLPQTSPKKKQERINELIEKLFGRNLGEWSITPKRWPADEGKPYYGLMFERDF